MRVGRYATPCSSCFLYACCALLACALAAATASPCWPVLRIMLTRTQICDQPRHSRFSSVQARALDSWRMRRQQDEAEASRPRSLFSTWISCWGR